MELAVSVDDIHQLVHYLCVILSKAEVQKVEELDCHLDGLRVVQLEVLSGDQIEYTPYQLVLENYLHDLSLAQRVVDEEFGKELYCFLSLLHLSRMGGTVCIISEASAKADHKLCHRLYQRLELLGYHYLFEEVFLLFNHQLLHLLIGADLDEHLLGECVEVRLPFMTPIEHRDHWELHVSEYLIVIAFKRTVIVMGHRHSLVHHFFFLLKRLYLL